MTAIAKKYNARNMVGLQGRLSPVVMRIKELLDGGRIGKVLSSSYLAAPSNGGATETWSLDYFTRREVGCSILTTGIGHSLEFIEYREWTCQASYLSYIAISPH